MARSDLIGSFLAEVAEALGRRPRGELFEELEGHLEDAVARHRAAGAGEQEALRMALQDFGTVEDLLAAISANSERKAAIMTASRWTGLAGIAAVPAAVLSMTFWHPAMFVLTLGLAAAAVVGLLARHWAYGRWPITMAVAMLVAGNVVARLNPLGSADLIYTVGIPLGCTLASVVLVGAVMLRGDAVPAGAVLLILGGVTILLGINAALYLMGTEPPILPGLGATAAIAGWIWTNGALAIKGSHPAAPATA